MQHVVSLENIEGVELLPEEAFLMRLLRGAFGGGNKRDFITLPAHPNIDWENLLGTALQWNVAPMLYRIIGDRQGFLNTSDIPDHVLKNIEAAYVKTTMVNKTNFLELTDFVNALSAADIPVLLLKGAHLAPFIYQDIGIRWMADIDIMIRREHLERAGGLLTEMDYEYPELAPLVWDDFGQKTELPDRAALFEWYKTDHMHLVYCNPKAIQSLELHWGIVRRASPFRIDTEGLWQRAWTEELNGARVWVLSPEDLLLHISLHDSYYHRLKRFGLRSCCDMAAVILRFSSQIDWQLLQLRAHEWGIEKYLHLMLYLTRELLGADIPNDVLETIRDKADGNRILSQAAGRVLGKETPNLVHRGMKHPIEIQVFNPDEPFSKKTGFFLRGISISREELASRYRLPASSLRIWPYYFLRLASILYNYAQVYVPYFWYRFKHGPSHRDDYTLDLWLKSPVSR